MSTRQTLGMVKMLKALLVNMLLMLGVMASSYSAYALELAVIKNGKSDYVIVTAENDTNKTLQYAAIVLKQHLKKATGINFQIIKESKFDGKAPAFYLGKTKAAARAKLSLRKIVRLNWLKAVKGKDIYLIGGGNGEGRKSKFRFRGTLKAVTSFLEEEVGVKFLMSGPKGTYTPSLKSLYIPANLYVFKKPTFAYVSGSNPRYLPYAGANNFRRSNILYTYGGHSYYSAVSKKKYAKTNPEYFAMRGGKRSSGNNHLCVSNKEVQELMVKELAMRFDEGYDWVELAQTDGYKPCQCDKCNAISTDEGERLWIVHSEIAKRMLRKYPDKKVMIISYGPTVNPPKMLKSLPRNVIVQMCGYSPKAFADWSKFKVSKTVYAYNWGTYQVSGFGPKRNPRYAAEQVKLFYRNKVEGLYLCGGFENMGLEGPVYYVYGKMLENPELDYIKVADEYYKYAFGKAEAPMKNFFKAMYKSLDLHSFLNRPNIDTVENHANAFITPEDWYCHYFPAKLLIEMRNNLKRAFAIAKDEDVKARLRLVDLEFKYVENLATMFQLYRAYRLNPTWEMFEILGIKIDERQSRIKAPGFINKKSGRINQFDGWVSVFSRVKKTEFITGGRLWGILGAPVSWNMKLLKEKRILPGVGKKTAKIKQIAKIVFDGKITDKAWDGIKEETLNEIALGELKNTATIKMGYDDKYMYFGVNCKMADIGKAKFDAYGHDGGVYGGECIELFLDPFGKREKFYQFIIGPVPNSYFDAQFGFITDPIHPLYNRNDKSWNGKWDYKSVIDKDNNCWTAEIRIPFKTLGVEKPKPGTTWTMNLGREHYPDTIGHRHGDPILSLWSPNLEERKFWSLAAFGELVFE